MIHLHDPTAVNICKQAHDPWHGTHAPHANHFYFSPRQLHTNPTRNIWPQTIQSGCISLSILSLNLDPKKSGDAGAAGRRAGGRNGGEAAALQPERRHCSLCKARQLPRRRLRPAPRRRDPENAAAVLRRPPPWMQLAVDFAARTQNGERRRRPRQPPPWRLLAVNLVART